MMDNLFATALLLAIGLAGTLIYQWQHSSRRSDLETDPVRTKGGFRWVYLWLQVSTVLLVIGCLNFSSATLLQWHESDLWRWAGVGVALLGLVCFVWAIGCLGENYSPCFDAREPSSLTTDGPYRLVRHPIYTSNLVLVVGFALATGSLWMVFNLLLLWFCYERTARTEERQLATAFPAYRAYVKRTRRFFPRVFL